MITTEAIGYIAGTLTTISFLPQAIKTIRTKQTHGISLFMYVIFTLGVLMWLLYGIMLGSIPIMLPNIITLILASIVLILKIIYG